MQGIGAFYYDRTWNDRILHVVRVPSQVRPEGLFTYEKAMEVVRRRKGQYIGVTKCDIDKIHCRHRLWSLRDNMIGYYVEQRRETRKRRYPNGWKDFALF